MASKVNTDKIARGSGSPEFTIPTADGTAGQAIVTNASGVLSFADAGASLTGSTATWIPTITGANALTGTANLTYDGNVLDVKNSGTASSINLYCETGNAHYIKIKSGPHASATSYTLTMPNAPPSTSGDVLAATTAGVGSWTTVPDTSLSNLSATGAEKMVKGWIIFDMSAGSIRDSFNVSSITDDGTGTFTIFWDTDFGSANYCVVCGGDASSGGGDYIQSQNSSIQAGRVTVFAYKSGGGTTFDPAYVSIMAIGDQ